MHAIWFIRYLSESGLKSTKFFLHDLVGGGVPLTSQGSTTVSPSDTVYCSVGSPDILGKTKNNAMIVTLLAR